MKITREEIKQQLQEIGMSQAEFARSIGATRNKLNGWITRGNVPDKWVKKFTKVLSGETIVDNNTSFDQIPFFNIHGNIFNPDENGLPDKDPDKGVVYPGVDADLILIAHEDSLAPRINKGDQLFCKYVKEGGAINYGYAFLIHTEDFSWIRQIMPGKDQEHFCLKAEAKNIPDLEFPISDIKNLYWIVNVFK